MKLVLENYEFLVYMYYTHTGYQTSIFGKNHHKSFYGSHDRHFFSSLS